VFAETGREERRIEREKVEKEEEDKKVRRMR
jgi:hypothetical protein